ncbi:MFS transporter [Cardiobacteriaceae bacterium TAE3-ERU3]|nr:MFS transporter [Cardiobacteriaceae bacterium TAE3-ERU3]
MFTRSQQIPLFIISFSVGHIAISMCMILSVWQFISAYSASAFTTVTLASLLLNTLIAAKYSYLLDRYHRKQIIIWLNIAMMLLVALAIVVSKVWLSAILMFACKLYFTVYFNLRSAVAQTMVHVRFQRINAALEITDQVAALLSAALITWYFSAYGLVFLLCTALVLLMVSVVLICFLTIHEVNLKHKPRKKPDYISFRWWLDKKVTWMVLLAMLPNILVLQSYAINPVMIYDVLGESPKVFAQINIIHSIGAMVGSLLALAYGNNKKVIIWCVYGGLIGAIGLAIYPSTLAFFIVMGLFGAYNSASHVAYGSLVMSCIANCDIGSYYGLRSSIVLSIQFLTLGVLTLLLLIMPAKFSVWLYPLSFLFLPVFALGCGRVRG